ncbi:MAG: hypothetical protein ACJ8AO_05535 [Gemmatimonadaceae bacterium]
MATTDTPAPERAPHEIRAEDAASALAALGAEPREHPALARGESLWQLRGGAAVRVRESVAPEAVADWLTVHIAGEVVDPATLAVRAPLAATSVAIHFAQLEEQGPALLEAMRAEGRAKMLAHARNRTLVDAVLAQLPLAAAEVARG